MRYMDVVNEKPTDSNQLVKMLVVHGEKNFLVWKFFEFILIYFSYLLYIAMVYSVK